MARSEQKVSGRISLEKKLFEVQGTSQFFEKSESVVKSADWNHVFYEVVLIINKKW